MARGAVDEDEDVIDLNERGRDPVTRRRRVDIGKGNPRKSIVYCTADADRSITLARN